MTLLDVICHINIDVIKSTNPQFKTTYNKIKQDTQYWLYFKDYNGAIDGAHIQVYHLQDDDS